MFKYTHFFGAAAAFALALNLAPVAVAADVEMPPAEEALSPFSVKIDGWLGYWIVSGEKENVVPAEDEGLLYGIDGKLRLDMVSGLSIQGDLAFEGVDEDEGDDYYQGGWIGGGHLSWSNPDSGLLGIFGGTGSAESDEQDTDFWFVGVEAQAYFDNWTLYGQAGYLDSEAEGIEEDSFRDAFFGRIVGRYFFDPENRLQAEFAYANGEQDLDDQDMDVFNWGVRFDHQLWENIAVFAAYDGGFYQNHDDSPLGEYYDHVFRGGLSVAFGRPDLLSIDRSGPNLDMPAIGRWAASGNIVD